MKQKKTKKRSGSTRRVPPVCPNRKRLWEIEPYLQCSVIGTCLSLSELAAISRKAGLKTAPRITEYEIHTSFVHHAKTANRVSKLMDKLLEKKHRAALQRFGRATSVTELSSRWDEAYSNGDVAGAYWAVTCHPLFNTALKQKVFGEVHMLSHVLGATRHADTRHLQKLETSCATLENKLAATKSVYRARLHNRDVTIEALSQRLVHLEQTERRLALAEQKIASLERDAGTDALRSRIGQLETSVASMALREQQIEVELSGTRVTLAEQTISIEAADAQNHQLSEENTSLELALQSSLICACQAENCPDQIAEDGTNLCGRKIMYVGGRSNLVRHYRALVERRGGVFSHHDGGMEDGIAQLQKTMTGIDAVICPIDCVSHNACLQVKQSCRRLAKPFIPLRSAGLSSLARGIDSIAQHSAT